MNTDKTRCEVHLWGGYSSPERYWGPLDKMLDYARSQKDTGISRIMVFNHLGDRVLYKAFSYVGY